MVLVNVLSVAGCINRSTDIIRGFSAQGGRGGGVVELTTGASDQVQQTNLPDSSRTAGNSDLSCARSLLGGG